MSELKWFNQQKATETELLAACENATSEIISNLLPRIREKALEEEYKSEVVLTFKLNLAKAPKVDVEGFVPPKIIKCRAY
jgi:hypothetical protein